MYLTPKNCDEDFIWLLFTNLDKNQLLLSSSSSISVPYRLVFTFQWVQHYISCNVLFSRLVYSFLQHPSLGHKFLFAPLYGAQASYCSRLPFCHLKFLLETAEHEHHSTQTHLHFIFLPYKENNNNQVFTTTTKPFVPSIWGRLNEPKENYAGSGTWIPKFFGSPHEHSVLERDITLLN